MRNKVRAVLDTNVFVSGLINAQGSPGEVLKMLRLKKFTLITSESINEEILDILNRDSIKRKYHLGHLIPAVKFLLWEVAVIVSDPPSVRVSSDPDDDKFLAAAKGGSAYCVVTGDVGDLLSLKKYKGIKILSPKEFLQFLKR